MWQPVPFIGSSGSNRSAAAGNQQSLNVYAEAVQDGEAVFHGTPGKRLFSRLGSPIRALKVSRGILYAVSGSGVFSLDSAGASTFLGTVGGGNPMSVADNGDAGELVFTDGDSWVLANGTVTKITDPDYFQSNSVTQLDGYGVWNRTGTGEFFFSAIDDFSDIDALDFASAESNSDNLIAVEADHRELMLFGSSTVEFWQTVANADAPFQRIPQAILEKGCIAPNSIAKLDNRVFWLGDDRIVYRLDQRTPREISSKEVATAIEAATAPEDSLGWTYTQEAHTFFGLALGGGGTWVFDTATGLWHERKAWTWDNWQVEHVAEIYKKVIVGGPDGNLYELDLDLYADNGETIQRRRTTMPIHARGREFTLYEVELELDTGVAVLGETAEVELEISSDRGRTWSSPVVKSFGLTGEYSKRVYWPIGGAYNDVTLRFTQTDAAKTAWVRAQADVEVLRG